MSSFVRPLLVAAILVVTAFYLGFPLPTTIALLAGSLVGYLIGSVNRTGAEFAVFAIAIASLLLVMVLASPSFSDQLAETRLYNYAATGWVVGFAIVGVMTLLSRPKLPPTP